MEPFATTQWGVVLACRDDVEGLSMPALESLCRDYWKPIFGCVRRAGFLEDDAEDLTQQFLADLIAKKCLARVDPVHGRFRSFLIASLRNFLSHEREKQATQKRGGGWIRVEGDSEVIFLQDGILSQAIAGPDLEFDRAWARRLLELAKARLASEYEAAGRGRTFRVLGEYLPGGSPETRMAGAAEILGTSLGAVKSEIHRMRQRFGQYLRAEVCRTVKEPSDVEQELRYLVQLHD